MSLSEVKVNSKLNLVTDMHMVLQWFFSVSQRRSFAGLIIFLFLETRNSLTICSQDFPSLGGNPNSLPRFKKPIRTVLEVRYSH